MVSPEAAFYDRVSPSFVDTGLAARHRQIKGLVLLIGGDRDPFFPIDRARQMVGDFPDGRGLITIERAKLLPHEEHPAVVLRHVQDFLATPAR